MPRMTKRERYEAIGMLRNMSINDVAAFFNVNRTTIDRHGLCDIADGL